MRVWESGHSVGSSGAAALIGALTLAMGCNALLDIDEVEFGDESAVGAGGAGAAAGTGGAATGTGTGAGTGGSPTGTSTGGTAATGGSGGSGGSGGTPCSEACNDGIDNDGNNLTDCEDPCCAAWSCVDPTYTSWTGPVAVYVGTDQGIACPSAWPDTEIDGGTGTITAPPASCTACSCGSASGISCNGSVTFYPAASCGGTGYPAAGTGSCQAVPSATLLHTSARAAAETASGGSCTPSGGVPTTVPATYATRNLACGGVVTGGGCAAGEVCLPPAPTGFDESLCIYRNGNRSCGGLGAFTEERSVHGEINDTRDCACSCGTPTGASCSGGTTRVYSPSTATSCTGSSQTLSHSGTCTALGANPGRMDYSPATPTGGSCPVSGPTTTGGAYDGDLYTLCCIPAN